MFDLKKGNSRFWVDLYQIDYELHIELTTLKALITGQEELILENHQKLIDEVNSNVELNKMEEEDRAAFFEFQYGFSQSVLDELERIQRYAMLTSIYSYIEGRLKNICEFIETNLNIQPNLASFKDQESLVRYWNYLIKSYKLIPKKCEGFFTKLKQDKIIRNIVNHQDGKLNQAELEKIGNRKGILISKLGEDYLLKIESAEYPLSLLRITVFFFDNLLDQIDERYEQFYS